MRPNRTSRASAAGVAAAALAALAVAGCGGSGGATGTGGSQSASLSAGDRSFLRFTACMRSHGIHMADPYHMAGHTGLTLAFPAKTPAVVRALPKCEHIIASVIAMKEAGMRARQQSQTPAQQTADHLGRLHYARCMRAHGIPMLDPDQNGNLNLGNVPGIGNVGRYDPIFRRADHACRSLLPAGVRDNGTGP